MSDWQTIKLRVETPMFCGGPNQEPGLRVSSIKGEIRFWLRAILGGVLGDNLDLIAEVESSLLGSTERSSKVLFRIPQQPDNIVVDGDSDDDDFYYSLNTQYESFKGLVYMLGQGLCQYSTETRAFHLTRGFIPIGATFDLKMRFTREYTLAERALLQWAMWAAFTIGGIGARNRRGFGRVRVDNCPGELKILANLPPNALLSPRGRDTILVGMRQEARSVATKVLGNRFRTTSPSEDFPSFSSMSSFKWDAHLDNAPFSNDWDLAFAQVGLKLRTFRANEEVTPQGYLPARKTHEWLHTIYGEQKSHFPLGALGLPIVFKGKNRRFGTPEEKVTAYASNGEVRWPSPLFLTLIKANNGYRLVSLFFITKFLPPIGGETATVDYMFDGRHSSTLQVEDQDASLLADQWFAFIKDPSVKRFTPRF